MHRRCSRAVGAFGDGVLGVGQVAVDEAHQTLVGACLCGVGVILQGLCQIGCGGCLVALVEGNGGEVVVGAVVLVVKLGGLLVDLLLLGLRVLQCGEVEKLVGTELGGVGLVLLLDLLVGASDCLVVDDEA